jgi:hypothetical protein
MYWARRQDILSCNREKLPDLVNQIAAEFHSSSTIGTGPKEVEAVGGQLALSAGVPLSEFISQFDGTIVIKAPPSKEAATVTKLSKSHLEINMSEGKRDQLTFLHQVLPAVDEFVQQHLDGSGNRLLIIDEGEIYDASVGILMLILGRHFDDSKREVAPQSGMSCT